MGVRVASFVAAGGGLILGSDATGRFRAFEACSSNPGEIRSVGREARISHNTRPHLRVALSAALLVLPSAMAESEASAQRATSDTGGLRAQVEAVATLAGEPQMVSAAGLTTDERPLLTLENRSAFDSSATERRLVLVGGLSGDAESARIVLDAVRWFKTAAPDRDRRRWVVSALPLAAPAASGRTQLHTFPPVDGFFNDADEPESRYVWRWVTYQAPDLVVEVRAGSEMTIQSSVESGARQADSLPAGSLAAALANQSNGTGLGAVESMLVTARFSDGATVMREALSRASGRRSALRGAIASRVSRDPISVARVLARRYPETPGMNYISAIAWVHTLRLATLTQDTSLREKVLQQVQPWLTGEQPLFGDRIRLNAVAGTMIFAEIAKSHEGYREAATRLTADGVARAAAERAPGVPQHGFGWSDDMFLGTIVASLAEDPAALDAAARLLIEYARRLQRSEGLFNHAADVRAAWGRGNGFAALGLAETLTALPSSHPARASLLDIYRRQMAALKTHQAPDGMWRQVIDVPGSYREVSVTALTLIAMARGVRLEWIEASYLPVVQRGWRALLGRVRDDGTLVDVCVSTGAGPSVRYYLDRPAVADADDRGGAMTLGAALEIYELNRSP